MTQALDDYLMNLADQLDAALEALELSIDRLESTLGEQQAEDASQAEDDVPSVQLRQKRRKHYKPKKKGDQDILEKTISPSVQPTRTTIDYPEADTQQTLDVQPFQLQEDDFPPLGKST